MQAVPPALAVRQLVPRPFPPRTPQGHVQTRRAVRSMPIGPLRSRACDVGSRRSLPPRALRNLGRCSLEAPNREGNQMRQRTSRAMRGHSTSRHPRRRRERRGPPSAMAISAICGWSVDRRARSLWSVVRRSLSTVGRRPSTRSIDRSVGESSNVSFTPPASQPVIKSVHLSINQSSNRPIIESANQRAGQAIKRCILRSANRSSITLSILWRACPLHDHLHKTHAAYRVLVAGPLCKFPAVFSFFVAMALMDRTSNKSRKSGVSRQSVAAGPSRFT